MKKNYVFLYEIDSFFHTESYNENVMDTRNTRVFESREMNRVSSTPHEYAEYANAKDEIDVPEYFNLPNLIKVSDGQKIFLTARNRVAYLKIIIKLEVKFYYRK